MVVNHRVYSKRLGQGEVFKDKNEEDYVRYFETITIGHHDSQRE
jgi:hypothetical protein